jgi:hypothetical protein
MGFIEETGAAQHYRDARILTIYEGTTAIQANDLVFRKTVRDQGAAVFDLLDEITRDMDALASQDNPRIPPLATAVKAAAGTARAVVQHILRGTNDPRRPAAGASNYLMLMGCLCGGWMITKSADAAARQLAADTAERTDFMNAKLGLAEIYATHHLPQIDALARTIMDGDSAVLAMETDWL